MGKMRIDILSNYFLNEDGTFNKDEAIILCGKIAGVCYSKEGFSSLENEDKEKTLRRIDRTLGSGHHSVYDHVNISFNLQDLPKILAMVINNEHQYTTSEKSARYTPVVRKENSSISEKEEELYNKWMKIFKTKIKEVYGEQYDDLKIKKLAQENARYLVTIFMPTQMIYTTSLRQINYLASWFEEYIEKAKTDFEIKLANSMKEFNEELKRLNVLDERLMRNEKERSISLFDNNIENYQDYFSNVYSINYKSSFAYLAQAQRHRTLDYKMELLDTDEYYIPEIILDNQQLVDEWLKDISSVKEYYPQGKLCLINETGTYENFILKAQERLCSDAQLEIMRRTKQTLELYQSSLTQHNNFLKEDIKKYIHGARCTFPNFKCNQDCHFKEGKLLTRRI